jgi:hypothetical protein
MKNIKFIISISAFVFFIFSCKKERPCPPQYPDRACELMSSLSYPKLDISNDPDAWYEADIEGSLSTMGTGYESTGFVYYGTLRTHFRTITPELPPGTPKVYEVFRMRFSLYNPSEELVGKSTALLEFQSPAFDTDTIADMSSILSTLLSPGIKTIDDGTDIKGSGWTVGLSFKDPIERAGQNNHTGFSLFTVGAHKTSPNNHFEITRSEAKDMGSFVRFTIWCNFKADLYNGLGEQPGWYFGQIRSGKAKLYVDVNK